MELPTTHFQFEVLLKNINISEFVQYLSNQGILLAQEVQLIKMLSSKQCIVDFLYLMMGTESKRFNTFLDSLMLFVSESLTYTLMEISKLKKLKVSSTNDITECLRLDQCSHLMVASKLHGSSTTMESMDYSKGASNQSEFHNNVRTVFT